VKYIRGIGGNTVETRSRRILRQLFTKSMAEKISWKGSDEKKLAFA